MADLDFSGSSIQIGDLQLRTPGLVGTADVVDMPRGPGLRAAGGTSDALQAALDRAGMDTRYVVDVQATALDMGAAGARAVGGRAGVIELDVPQPNEREEQAVLSVDPNGITTWSFAPRTERKPAFRSGAGSRTFEIPRHPAPPPAPGEAGTRSIFGEIGKQVLKVVAFPIGDKLGQMANSFLGQWEASHMDYGVRNFGPADYQLAPVYFNGDSHRWQELAAGRTLLFIHGTHSRSQGAFGALPADQMARFKALYGDRIIAFDHRTLSEDPIENISWLVNIMPPGQSLDVDVICHSRGGLVSRALSEWPGAFPGNRQIRVHRLALVGATNNGTILADVKHWNDMVNVLSTVMNSLGVAVGDSIDLVLSFVRQLAVAAYPRVRGLSCMVPSGKFLTDFNGRPLGAAKYLSIASNYEPTDGRLASFFNDTVKDAIFEMKDNDAMVRVDSVCGTDVKGEFQKVKDTLVLPGSRGIEHSYYFGQTDVADEIVTFFQAGLP